MTQTLTPENVSTNGAIRKAYGGLTPQPIVNQDRGFVLGIFGPGGMGKTTTAATITDSEMGSPALWLDARGNTHVVVTKYGNRIDFVPITEFKQIEAIRRDLVADKNCPYKSIVLDNVTEMWNMNVSERAGNIGNLDYTKYSAVVVDLERMVRAWVDVAYKEPKLNVIFIFQESPEPNGDVTVGPKTGYSSRINMNKALQHSVPGLITFLGRLYVGEGPPSYRRVLSFSPIESLHQAKRQIDPAHPEEGKIPFDIWNPSLAAMLDTIRYNKEWPEKNHLPSAPAPK